MIESQNKLGWVGLKMKKICKFYISIDGDLHWLVLHKGHFYYGSLYLFVKLPYLKTKNMIFRFNLEKNVFLQWMVEGK